MAFAFDTLGYAKRLRSAGVPQAEAEGHAEAAREFIMAELVTRNDLDVAMTLVRSEFHQEFASVRQEIASMRRDLEGSIERISLRMTVRLGGMIAIAVAILAGIVKL